MLGFKRFENAEITISGIELIHKIKKKQFDTSKLGLEKAMIVEVWAVVLGV
jgi:transposase-like protein